MDATAPQSPQSPTSPSTSPSRRSSIPIPKRKSSLHLYIAANNIGGGGPSGASTPSSASSTHEDQNLHSASSSRSATAMSMHSSLYLPRSSAAAELQTGSEFLQLRESHNQLVNKCEEITRRNQNLESTNQLLKKSVASLQRDIAGLQKERTEFVDKNRKLKKKLSEIVPSGGGSSCSEDEDPGKRSGSKSPDGDPDPNPEIKTSSRELDSLLNEMEKLKSYLNNVELQLYEANEKISELQEGKQQFEETNEKLRAENAELSKIARLMSVNILESIDNSKRLENTYIQVRRERDQLVRQNRDSVDSKTGPSEEIQKMRSEMELKRKTFEAQFIEYKSLMEQELSRNTNEQIVTLQLEVDALKEDLADALNRAERAEDEARELRALLRQSQIDLQQERQFYSQLDLDKLSLRDGDNDSLASGISGTVAAAPPPPMPPPPPPPPPPPMMAGGGAVAVNRTSGSGLGLSEAISTQKLNHVGIKHVNTRQQQATGLDSVIADIKSGRVTLRRRKPNLLNDLENATAGGTTSPELKSTKSTTSHSPGSRLSQRQVAKNPALGEMYEILERMKRRNRKSKVILESELVPFSILDQEATSEPPPPPAAVISGSKSPSTPPTPTITSTNRARVKPMGSVANRWPPAAQAEKPPEKPGRPGGGGDVTDGRRVRTVITGIVDL